MMRSECNARCGADLDRMGAVGKHVASVGSAKRNLPPCVRSLAGLGAVLLALLGVPTCATAPGKDSLSPRAAGSSDSGQFEPSPGAEPGADGWTMRAMIERFTEDRAALQRFYAIPGAKARQDRLVGFYAAWKQRLESVDFTALDRAGRVDYVLMRHELDYQLAQLGHERRKWEECAALLPFAEAIIELEERRCRLETVDSRDAAQRVDAILRGIKEVRERIEEGRKKPATPDAAAAFGTLLDPAPSPPADSATAPPADSATAPPTAPTAPPSVSTAPSAASTAPPAVASDASTSPSGAAAAPPGNAPMPPPADGPTSKETTKKPPLSVTPVTALRAARFVDALRGTLRGWFTYHDGYQPDFSWWVRRPHEDAAKALEEYAKFLREEIAGLKGKDEDPLVGDPIGADALRDDLAHELMPYSPGELVQIAEAQFAWCEAEMKKAAADLKFDDWKQALEHVKNLHVPPGEQAGLVARQAVEAIEFIDRLDLVTVPDLCRELWRLEMIDERAQRQWPFAFYGGQHMAVAYAMANMEHDKKLMAMRGNNIHFTRIVTPHELIPGHHLQGFMAQRHRPYRRLFGTPFYVEGWALHWEMLLWDLDYARGPEDRIGMLFWRMHRAARIIVSLKYHLGQMTPQEMIDFLVQRVGHEKENATSEVRRYIGGDYSPLYQCGYLVGGLQVRALHRELVGGGRMTHRQFHDAVLTLGPIPIELVRAGLTDVPLTRNYETCWRFMED
ncbi:MAG: hypothetical protein FLDDKLPJ_03694 [Phycisphaerae bacterium]|nr:hypothetical protein [Phycisphaerae bacterium]